MKSALAPICFVLFAMGCTSKPDNNKQQRSNEIATAIFEAWHTGERGEGYAAFMNYVDEKNFAEFSHPLTGSFTGAASWQQFQTLIKSREAKPNHLRFSNVMQYRSDTGRYCFQFDSEGTVGDGFSYKGYNVIQLTIVAEKLIGFREYFGYIDPAWFK